MSQIQKWPKIKSRSDATALRAEGAQVDVRSALHSPDHPPFFVFLSFSCFYIYCGSMCSMGSMWAQQSYSAVLHLHLWWYYFINISILNLILLCDPSSSVLPFIHCCSGSPSLKAISESEGICQFAEGKTFSGQVKVQTLFTSLKLESNEIWISIKSHCPLLTPELNILSSISAMHVQQKCMLHTAVLPWQIWNCAVRNTKWLLAANPC